MSDSSDDEEEKKDENILDKPIYVKKPGNTTGDMLDADESSESSEESSDSGESSYDEEDEESKGEDQESGAITNQIQAVDRDKLKMTWERPILARCVNKLPKRGQLVNLN